MPSFLSTTAVSPACFFRYKVIFITAITHNVGTTILSRINDNCAFLASKLNRIFVLLEMLSQYLGTAIIKGVYRTLPNMVKLFAKICNDR